MLSLILEHKPIKSSISMPAVHGAMGYKQKSFKLVWRCHQLLTGSLANGHLPRVSRLSANVKDDNEVIPGAVPRSHGF